MGDQPGARADAMLRRPVVDPGVPAADRALLTANRALLTPAGQDRPARRRDYLPTDPAKRLETVDGAVIAMTSAMVTAVFGTVPLAVGTLLLQDPTSWEYTSNRYSLLLAQLITIVTAVILGVRIARFGQPNGQVPAAVAARTHHGRYLTDADFDARPFPGPAAPRAGRHRFGAFVPGLRGRPAGPGRRQDRAGQPGVGDRRGAAGAGAAAGQACGAASHPPRDEGLADAIITGRDELGFPKLAADIPDLDVDLANGRVSGTASWLGFEFFSAELTSLAQVQGARPPTAAPLLTFKYVPRTSPHGTGGADIAHVTTGAAPANGSEPGGGPAPGYRRWAGTGEFHWHTFHRGRAARRRVHSRLDMPVNQ